MANDVNSLDDYIAALRRRKVPAVGVMFLILLVSVSVAFGLPAVYRSTATILIEAQDIPQELVQTTVTTYADRRIQVVRQRVMSRANLMAIIEKFDLHNESQGEEIDATLDRLVESISMETITADEGSGRNADMVTIAFTVSYDSESPELAQKVADELASLYLAENLRSRTESVNATSAFLAEEAGKLNTQISELEAELAEFKKRHADTLPEMLQWNMGRMDRTEQDLEAVSRQIQALRERRILLQSQLAQVSAQRTRPFVSETGEMMLPPAERLTILRNQYLSLSARYSGEHPDLIRIRKEMEALAKEVGASNGVSSLELQLAALQRELVAARERYSDEHPDVVQISRTIANIQDELTQRPSPVAAAQGVSDPSNPAYIQLRAQLDAVNTELNSLQEELRDLREKGLLYEERLLLTPQVERDYRALVREHEGAQAKYREIKGKQMQAQLGQALEVGQKGERFTLIGKPRLPSRPESPNRIAIVFLGMVLSFAGGVGTVAVAEATDNTVRGRKGVADLLGAAPLAAIPHIETKADKQRKLWRRALSVALVIGAILLVATLFHWLGTPLDEAWLDLLRRFNLEESWLAAFAPVPVD